MGASPDGITDDGVMVEIKCPPKRKFTKTVPPHYKMQVLGQLEVCNLDDLIDLKNLLITAINKIDKNFKLVR